MGDGPKPNAKWSKYSVSEDGTLTRKAEFCPDPGCGPGVFLAIHKDRKSCGRCGYTVKNE
ncbi:MAG: 30S ribosomal protein S27ae [Candidatus Poseidoniales archaeon]|nr:30S ribosomal protein S27ae [Euryarchaeota archaeon]MDP6235686.1 hypothetical protein [Candidatus Poseidoniaceae archaeon]RJU91739.1 MAG: 30S ribosomal protein S27ae [Candidatus Poseidoniales archaeon]